VATHIEQLLNGLQLKKARLGRVIDSYQPQAGISNALDAILADDDMRQYTTQAGHEHRSMLASMKPLETFKAAALKFLAQ
jgi:UDP:flavonoid glycosyltransferase YjiC (YdhE family)